MRSAFLLASGLTLLALSACAAPESTEISYRSTFEGSTKGVILHEDGAMGHAGMFGSNCPFDTFTGEVTGDYDLPDEGEDVQDGEETDLGEITLTAVIPGTIHVLDKTGGDYMHVSLPLEGAVEGRLVRDGVVGLSEDCTLSWLSLEGETRSSVQVEACGGELETDPDSGLTLVSDASGLTLTDGEAVTALDLGADLVAFDDEAGLFYVARAGEPWLAAIGPDGSERWSVETSGPVTALDDGGATASAGVVLELDGGGAVAFFDAADGERVRYAETPSAADDLAVSGDGRVVALVRPEQTFFFELGLAQ